MTKPDVADTTRIINVHGQTTAKEITNRIITIDRPNGDQVVIKQPTTHISLTNQRLTERITRIYLKTGAQGTPGRDGVGANYTHTQDTASSIWTIRHNLGRHPSVQVIINDREVFPSVEYQSINIVQIQFLTAETGEAYLI